MLGNPEKGRVDLADVVTAERGDLDFGPCRDPISVLVLDTLNCNLLSKEVFRCGILVGIGTKAWKPAKPAGR